MTLVGPSIVNNRYYPRSDGSAGGEDAGPWDRTGTIVHLDHVGDTVVIGANVMAGAEKFRVVGNSRFEGDIDMTGNLLLAAASYARFGLAPGSGAGSAAGAGTLRFQDDFVQAFRDASDTFNVTAIAADGADSIEIGGVLGGSRPRNITADALTEVALSIGGTAELSVTNALIDVPTNNLRLGLAAGSGAGAAASAGTIRLQDNFIQAFRDSTDGADMTALAASGADVLQVGGVLGGSRPTAVIVDPATYGYLARNGGTVFYWTGTFVRMYVPTLSWQSAVTLPVAAPDDRAASGVTCTLFTVHGQNVDSGGAGASTAGALDLIGGEGIDPLDNGGHAYLSGGRNTGAGGGTDGNVGINARAGDTVNFQSMERGIYIINVVTVPAGAPSGGGFLYSNAGAGTWRGTSGTVTVFAAAGPHCGRCGYDSWTVAAFNPIWRSWQFICGHCGAEYRGGPRSVLKRLSDRQRSELLQPDMSWDEVSEVLRAA